VNFEKQWAVSQTLAMIAGRAAMKECQHWDTQGHLGMNTPPIVSPEAWEAARQQMLAKEKAHARAGDPLADENRFRNFPPGPDQTEISAPPRAGTYKASRATVENHSRALSRFLIVFCGGVAATLAWWSYGDAARRIIASSYPQLRSLAPPRAVTAPKAPDMIVRNPNQLDATLREPHTMPQSPDRIVVGEELTHNTDQTKTSVDQAPSAQADSIPLKSRGDGASLQPGVPLDIKSAEAKAPQTLSEKGKQVSAASQYDASCLPSVWAVLQKHPGGWPMWTLRAPGHEGTQCWYAASRPRVSNHRPRASDHRTETTGRGLSAPSFP
jgi:Bacterial protein of unknown function (DUF899)